MQDVACNVAPPPFGLLVCLLLSYLVQLLLFSLRACGLQVQQLLRVLDWSRLVGQHAWYFLRVSGSQKLTWNRVS
jgi:hypothetical protein